MSRSTTGSAALARPSNAVTLQLLALSVALWAVGVATVHLAAPSGLFDGSFATPLLTATVPLVWLTLRLVGRIAGSALGTIAAVALVSMPALLLDGLALTWMPTLYSNVATQQRAAGGWLLWFVGLSLAMAISRDLVTAWRPGDVLASRRS